MILLIIFFISNQPSSKSIGSFTLEALNASFESCNVGVFITFSYYSRFHSL